MSCGHPLYLYATAKGARAGECPVCELEQLRGDLHIARLGRDAKLCSQCPRTGELELLRAALSMAAELLTAQRRPTLQQETQIIEALIGGVTFDIGTR